MQQSIKVFSDKIIAKLNQLIARDGFVTLAVSGGKSPVPLFEYLSHNDTVAWDKVNITLLDERATNNQQDRNDTLVRQHLLQHHAKSATFVPLYDESKTVTENINRLNSSMLYPKIAILGMGLDGHTASIFPCCPEFEDLLQTDARFAIASPTTAPYKRITFTLSAILAIENLFLFAQDQPKQDLLKQITQQTAVKYPIVELIKHKELLQ